MKYEEFFIIDTVVSMFLERGFTRAIAKDLICSASGKTKERDKMTSALSFRATADPFPFFAGRLISIPLPIPLVHKYRPLSPVIIVYQPAI
jgi:hypothetical protein